MAEFDRKSLGEVLGERGYIRGPFGSALVRGELQKEGIPVYEQQHAITGTREFRFFVDEEKFKELSRFQVRPNDLIISCSGTIGRISVIRPDDPMGIISQALLILRPHSRDVLPEFLYYFLSTREGQHALVQASHGSVQVNIAPRAVVEQIELPVPGLGEQRAITHILGTLDGKIGLNRRMNETLEAMTRALFKSWFVDFDPVRAKTEGRDPGLPQPLADLFPASFEDSELGEIPKGWRAAPFREAALLQKDTVNPLDTPDAEFSHFSIPAYDEGETPKREFGASIKSLKFRVPDDGILFSKLNPSIERVWFVDSPTKATAVCSTEFLVFRARPPFTRSFVYSLARSTNFRRAIQSSVTGTSNSHQRTQPDSVLSILSPLPSRYIINAFEKIVGPLLRDIQIKNRESRTLAALRDTLLPKLISGETRFLVRDDA